MCSLSEGAPFSVVQPDLDGSKWKYIWTDASGHPHEVEDGVLIATHV